MPLFIALIFLFTFPEIALSETNAFQQIDNVKAVTSEEDLPELVKELTQPLKDDKDKALELLTWIAQNIDYDNYKMTQIKEKEAHPYSRKEIPESGDILKTRLGVCEDIARLYQKMLKAADIKAVVIHGCTGEINTRKNGCKDGGERHAWNAVWIDKQWELVDPTWAITGSQTKAMADVTKKRKYERELKKRQKKSSANYEPRKDRSVDQKWFMTPPEEMAKDHQPHDKKWFLTKKRDRKNKNL